jgi:hypothetical protein
VAEACAGVTDESHAQALAVMRLYAPLIEVVSLAGAVAGAAGRVAGDGAVLAL